MMETVRLKTLKKTKAQVIHGLSVHPTKTTRQLPQGKRKRMKHLKGGITDIRKSPMMMSRITAYINPINLIRKMNPLCQTVWASWIWMVMIQENFEP